MHLTPFTPYRKFDTIPLNPLMGCKPPVSLWRCGAEPGAIPALAFLRERFSFRAVYVERGIDIRAIYVILNANIPPENVVAALDSFQPYRRQLTRTTK